MQIKSLIQNKLKSTLYFQNPENFDHVWKCYIEILCIKHTYEYLFHLKISTLDLKDQTICNTLSYYHSNL